MIPLIAALSFVAMALLYAFPSHNEQTVFVTTDLCWSWSAAFAAICCFNTARRVTSLEQRRTWRWIGAGCASFLVGALVWTYYAFWLRATPPYPSLADAAFLGIYVCLIVGIMTLVRGQPTRRTDPELLLDAVLVTFTVGALAYEYLLEPLLRGATPGSPVALWTSIGWSIGGVAVLWMVLIEMLRRIVFPVATAVLVLPGIVALAIGSLVYAVVALGGSYREPSGSGTDVGDGFSRTNCQNIHDAVDLKTLVPARRIENREIPGVRLAGSTVLGWSLRRRRWILPANGYGSVQAEKQGLNTKATFEHGRRLQSDCLLRKRDATAIRSSERSGVHGGVRDLVCFDSRSNVA